MKKLADHIRQAHEDAEDVQITSRKITQQFQRIEAAEIEAVEVEELPGIEEAAQRPWSRSARKPGMTLLLQPYSTRSEWPDGPPASRPDFAAGLIFRRSLTSWFIVP